MRSAVDTVEVRVIGSVDAGAVARLYRLAGWWDEKWDGGFIVPMAAGSAAVAGAFAGTGEMVGFARAISDGASDAYIQDVVVDPRFRRRGIASEMVRTLVRELRRRGVDWIGLIGAPGTRGLYERCGFEVMAGHVPMRWNGRGADGGRTDGGDAGRRRQAVRSRTESDAQGDT